MQATGLEGVNAIGVGALLIFLAAWVAAAIAGLRLHRSGLMREAQANHGPMGVWKEPSARRGFLTFIAFCALGVASAAIGFLFGGFPTR